MGAKGLKEIITSKNNPKIKYYRSLRSRKGRQETGLCLVEGIRHVGDAIQSGSEIEAIVYCPDLLRSGFANQLVELSAAKGISCLEVSQEVFSRIAEKENPQGLLAVTHQKFTQLEDLQPANFPWGVALVAPQDPGNIGTILRTIDAVGAGGLILLDTELEHSAEPYHPSAVRASMGSIFWLPIVHTRFEEFISWKSKWEYTLVGSSAHSGVEIDRIDQLDKPCLLLLGSEREGLTTEQSANCDWMLRLPMFGRVTSLNLSVAAGVLMYAIQAKLK